MTPTQLDIALALIQQRTADKPIAAYDLASRCGHVGSKESRRRRAREIVAKLRAMPEYQARIGVHRTSAGGIYWIQTAAEREAMQRQLRSHGKRELWTARKSTHNERQEQLI